MFDSARAHLLSILTLPPEWHVIDEQRLPSTLDRVTVIVKHDRVEPLAESPIGHLSHQVVLAVFTPHQDLAKAEDALDRAITEIITDIDGDPTAKWTEAQKVIHPNGLYPGWELTVTVNTQKETP